MKAFINFIQNILINDKDTIKIGLSQFKEEPIEKKNEPSIKNKDIKLSDLMTDVEDSSFIYKVLTELTDKEWEEITISNVTGLTFDDIKLATFLDYQSNKTIFDVIVDCVNTGKGPSATPVTYEDVTISDLSYISNLDGIKLSTVLPYEGENIEIYDILLGVVNDNKAPGEE
ncbi:hypothetical protein IJD34_01260, partial [bacterium]|nr:hypothetical protein [bacterium]